MVRLRLLALVAIPLLAGAARLAAAQEPASPIEVRAYPVLELLDPYAEPAPPPVGRVLACLSDESWPSFESWPDLEPNGYGDDPAPTLFSVPEHGPVRHADRLIDHLRESLGRETCEREVAWMEVRGGVLYVAASPTILEQTDRLVRGLRPKFAPRFQFDYALFRADARTHPGKPSRLTVAEADALLDRLASGEGGTVLYRARAQTRAGDGFQFGEGAIRPFQSDLDAEIAEAAATVEPRVSRLALGHDLTGQSMLASDGRGLGLFGLLTRRRFDGPPQPLDLVASGFRLERARIRTVQAAFSILLPADGAVVLRPGGWLEADLAVLLVVRRLDEAPRDGGSPTVIPVGCLTSPAFTGTPGGLSGVTTLPTDGEFLIDRALTIGRTGTGEEALRVVSHTHLAVFSGDPEAVRRSVAFVRTVADRTERSYCVELVRQVRAGDGPGSGWRAAGSIVVPCMANRLAFVTLGDEETHVVGHDVEVAQKSKIYDPVVQAVFDGTQAVVAIEPEAGVCRVTIALLHQVAGPTRLVPPPSPDLGPFWIPTTRHAIFRRTMLMTPGTTHVLGDIPSVNRSGEAPDDRARLSIRIVEL